MINRDRDREYYFLSSICMIFTGLSNGYGYGDGMRKVFDVCIKIG